MDSKTLPNFTHELICAGETDTDRAERLGIPLRTFKDYKAGRLPKGMRRLMRPNLLRALANDAEQLQRQAEPAAAP